MLFIYIFSFQKNYINQLFYYYFYLFISAFSQNFNNAIEILTKTFMHSILFYYYYYLQLYLLEIYFFFIK